MIIGAQFYTLRNSCKTLEGLDESLKKVADIGFTAVQLSGVCDYSADWAAEKAKEYGLKIAITHFPLDKIADDTDNTIAFHKAMDCPYIGLGSVPGGIKPDNYAEFVERITPAVKKISDAGLKFMYHNHNQEFAKLSDGKTYLDMFCDKFGADEFGITLDTYWVQAGGGDPAQWIKKMKGRDNCVHFKDMVFNTGDNKVRIAPIGAGNMNYEAIIEACLESGVEYGFVELDDCYGEDPFKCMKDSYEFLKTLGVK